MPAAVSVDVHARAGLLGNPSDGYGGRVVAFTISQLAATVVARPGPAFALTGGSASHVVGHTVADVERAVEAGTLGNGTELLAAAIVAMNDRSRPLPPVELEFETTIPRQVGLAGSSAIVIAAMRAVAGLTKRQWEPLELARRALEAETDVLGLMAGPQDRVVQAMGGLVDMNFERAWDAAGHQRLDPAHLPPLWVAWDNAGAESSSVAHTDVRARWTAGESVVHSTIESFARLGARGAAALTSHVGSTALADMVDEAFELRCAIWPISRRDQQLIDIARAHDAGGAFAGSGGAVMVVPRNLDRLAAIRDAYSSVGAHLLQPRIGPPT